MQNSCQQNGPTWIHSQSERRVKNKDSLEAPLFILLLPSPHFSLIYPALYHLSNHSLMITIWSSNFNPRLEGGGGCHGDVMPDWNNNVLMMLMKTGAHNLNILDSLSWITQLSLITDTLSEALAQVEQVLFWSEDQQCFLCFANCFLWLLVFLPSWFSWFPSPFF